MSHRERKKEKETQRENERESTKLNYLLSEVSPLVLHLYGKGWCPHIQVYSECCVVHALKGNRGKKKEEKKRRK